MNKNWLLVVIAAGFEVAWVIGLKHANNFLTWSLTILAIIICFYGLIKAGENLPVGTVYAVFVGLGTSGIVIMENLIFGEVFNLPKLFLILLLLGGVVGLKLVTHEEVSGERDNV